MTRRSRRFLIRPPVFEPQVVPTPVRFVPPHSPYQGNPGDRNNRPFRPWRRRPPRTGAFHHEPRARGASLAPRPRVTGPVPAAVGRALAAPRPPRSARWAARRWPRRPRRRAKPVILRANGDVTVIRDIPVKDEVSRRCWRRPYLVAPSGSGQEDPIPPSRPELADQSMELPSSAESNTSGGVAPLSLARGEPQQACPVLRAPAVLVRDPSISAWVDVAACTRPKYSTTMRPLEESAGLGRGPVASAGTPRVAGAGGPETPIVTGHTARLHRQGTRGQNPPVNPVSKLAHKLHTSPLHAGPDGLD